MEATARQTGGEGRREAITGRDEEVTSVGTGVREVEVNGDVDANKWGLGSGQMTGREEKGTVDKRAVGKE